MKQLTRISVHHSTETRHGKVVDSVHATPHPTSHNHDPSVLLEDAAARGRFDTYLAQTTRTHHVQSPFVRPGEHHQTSGFNTRPDR